MPSSKRAVVVTGGCEKFRSLIKKPSIAVVQTFKHVCDTYFLWLNNHISAQIMFIIICTSFDQ